MRQRATRMSCTGNNYASRSDVYKAIFAGSSPGFRHNVDEAIKANKAAGVWGMASGWTLEQIAASKLFRDSEKTLPVYAKGDPVGYLDSVSGLAFPLIQANSMERPVVSARVNFLVATDDLTKAAWTKSDLLATPFGDGSFTVSKLTAASSKSINQGGATSSIAGGVYLSTFELFAGTASTATVGIGAGSDAVGGAWGQSIDTSAAVLSGPGSVSGASLFSVSGLSTTIPTKIKITRKYTNAGVNLGTYIYPDSSGSTTIGASIRVKIPDARLSINATIALPPYQRVTSPTDYDDIGFLYSSIFDGTDDNQISASGGGATTGFFFCAGIQVGKITGIQRLFDDRNATGGFCARISDAKFGLTTPSTPGYVAETGSELSVSQKVVLTAWQTGSTLNVQINNGTVASVACPAVLPGTAQITSGKTNNAASDYFQGGIFERVYRTGVPLTDSEREAVKRRVAKSTGVTL